MRIGTALELSPASDAHWSEGLDAVARHVFPGRRSRGWLARKTTREHARPESSPVLFDDEGVPRGYVLLGWPPSLHDTARTAGVGLEARLRGQGLGVALMEAAVERARDLGASRLRTLSPPALTRFYARVGLLPVRARWTLVAPGLGEHPPARRELEWAEAPGAEVASWLRETWTDSPTASKHALTLGQGDSALLTAEGGGWLCHRLGLCDPAAARWAPATEAMRHAVPADSRLWLYGCPALGAGPISLLDRGWRVVQRVIVLERELY